jgi:hypothetical protein
MDWSPSAIAACNHPVATSFQLVVTRPPVATSFQLVVA